MKRLILFLSCICFCLAEMKSQTILEAIEKTAITNFPFYHTYRMVPPVDLKLSEIERPYDISSLAQKIPINNSYKDINATIKDTQLDDTEILLSKRFHDQNGKYFFYAESRYTDSSISDYLVLMGTDGTISDYLWSGLYFPNTERIKTMDFKIDASGTITVYKILCTSGTIDPYNRDITSFTGQRTDKTYQIVNGKFVLKSIKTYQPIVYKFSDLIICNKKIWEGKEVPL